MTDSNKDKSQVLAWTSLGHPAFDNDYLLSLENPEWWSEALKSDDIINS
jgi:hypothetical protein